MPDPSIKELIARYMADELTEQEFNLLWESLQSGKDQQLWDELTKDVWDNTTLHQLSTGRQKERVLRNILQAKPLVRPMYPIRRWVAAAAIFILLLCGSYFIFFNKGKNVVDTTAVAQDVQAPAIYRATLRLADGRIIVLDTAATGQIAVNANKINDGELRYEPNTTAVQYHTLSVPYGSRPMQLELADGTVVWLNVGSSITYPTGFPGTERKVNISGEAYFEVAKNAGKKFLVAAKNITTEVLGTHFNIKSYDDEADVKVTLLEGKISVNGTLLIPGQQAQVRNAIKINNDVDLEEVMAWKNGLFKFNKADIATIMKQVARWYDMDIKYEGQVNGSFGGTIPNNVNVSKLLAMLELTDHVRFNIDGRTITVKPYSN